MVVKLSQHAGRCMNRRLAALKYWLLLLLRKSVAYRYKCFENEPILFAVFAAKTAFIYSSNALATVKTVLQNTCVDFNISNTSFARYFNTIFCLFFLKVKQFWDSFQIVKLKTEKPRTYSDLLLFLTFLATLLWLLERDMRLWLRSTGTILKIRNKNFMEF